MGLIGSNGAGKTTTLKIILGLTAADGGDVRLLGCDPRDSKDIDKIKARVGIVLDTCAFPDVSKVADVGTLGRAAYATWDDGRFKSLCDEFGLELRKTVKDLSRGMGMKLTLAFALDPMARDEVLDILRHFMEDENHAILISTHITSDLEKIADEVICIENGHMVFDLPKDAICDEAGIAHCRIADLEGLVQDGRISDSSLALQRGMSTDVLVPDRFAFARDYPGIPVDRATIEDYMTLALKGEPLKEVQ